MKPDRKQQTKPQREVHPPVRSKAEDAEPATGTGGLPIFVFILLGIGIYFSMVYLDNHAGGFNAIVPRGFSSSNELTQLIPFDPAREGILKGQRVYSQTCFACHQPTGQGTPGMFPPLDGSEWVTAQDPSRLIRIILDGITGPITVKGQQWPGTTVMPGFRGTGPTDEDIANVATYVRNSWSNKAAPVKPEMVKAIREETSAHAGRSWTADDLLKVPLKE